MKTFLMAVIGLVFSAPTWGAMPLPSTVEYVGNRVPGAGQILLGTQLTKLKVQVAKGTYDFAKQGGSSTADINLRGPDGKAMVIPDNAVIKQVLIDVLTPPNVGSPMPTIALNAASAGDLKAAANASTYSGLMAGIPIGTAATMIKLSAPATLSATIGASTLTAGKFNVFVEYYLSD